MMMKQRFVLSLRGTAACALGLLMAATGCRSIAGSLGIGAREKAEPEESSLDAAATYYTGSYVDSGAKKVGENGLYVAAEPAKRYLPLRADNFNQKNVGDRRTAFRKNWMLFHSTRAKGRSLAVEFRYNTTERDKSKDKLWAQIEIGFGDRWATTDVAQARYLVLWAKANKEVTSFDLRAALESTTEARGRKATGFVSLSEYATDKRIGTDWTKITVPITAFPDIHRVDIGTTQKVVIQLAGDPPENQDLSVRLDNIFFTDAIKVTPVENVGYLVRGDGVLLLWDKAPIESPKHFSIRSESAELLTVPGRARMALLKEKLLEGGKLTTVGIVAVGEEESSSPVWLRLDTRRPLEERAIVRVEKEERHEISPYVLGANWAEPETIKEVGVTVNRWGGVRTTKYNWEYDVDSSGADFYFMNGLSKKRGTPEDEKGYWGFIEKTADAGASVNFTLPIGPFIAKPHMEDNERFCAFPKEKFREQNSFDPTGTCGDGLDTNGAKIWDNDPLLSNVANSPEHQRKFLKNVKRLLDQRATQKKKTELLLSLDNEPGLWFEKHRDSSPAGLSAEELVKLNVEYAKVVKEVLPDARVIGLSAWGPLELAGSNVDFTPPGPEGYKRYGEFKAPGDQWRDRQRLKYSSQFEYYLQQLAAAEKKAGKRLVDIVDVHWYPDTVGVSATGETLRLTDNHNFDPVLVKQQFDALREWYDPTYTNPTWLAQGENRLAFWDPWHPVIPALRRLVDKHYPGTKLAINEYDVGSRDFYHGAVLRVAALGIFMQEDLYMAQVWHQPAEKRSFAFLAQRLYGNYDGRGSRVGGKFHRSVSGNPDVLSFVANNGKRWYAVLVNKNLEARMRTTVALPAAVSRFRSYVLAQTLGERLLETEQQPATGERVAVYLPPLSATLIVAE
jgi:hypothetical protein